MRFSAILWVLTSAVLGCGALESAARPKTLRVCADPDYLPYSNRAGQGFENKIAQAVAKALGTTVEYTWAPSRRHGGFSEFLSSTLDAKKCDVVMNIPNGSREELTTRPYYIPSYVFVFKKSRKYNIAGMDSSAPKQLKIGFESGTPAEDGLRMRGLLERSTSFDIAENSEETPTSMLTALESRKIDVLITWEPAITASPGCRLSRAKTISHP